MASPLGVLPRGSVLRILPLSIGELPVSLILFIALYSLWLYRGAADGAQSRVIVGVSSARVACDRLLLPAPQAAGR